MSLSRVVGNASSTIRKASGWAGGQGYRTLGSSGREQLDFGTGSSWLVASEHGVWGRSLSLVLLDEGWSATSDLLEQAIAPTLIEKSSSEVWLISTANELATSLVPRLRAEAIAGSTTRRRSRGRLRPGPILTIPRGGPRRLIGKPEGEPSIRSATPAPRHSSTRTSGRRR